MNKKKIIAVIILITGIVLIGCGIFFSIGNTGSKSSKKDKVDTPQKEENPKNEEKDISYEEAVKIVESLYKEEGYTFEIKEEDTRFVINKKNDNGDIVNTFYLDKKTGYFSEEAKSSTTVEPIQVG